MNVVIVEDDELQQELLQIMLRSHFVDMKLAGVAYGVEDGLSLIESVKPDLVFLDIQLGSKTCFDLLERLESRNFDIIFITSHAEHALEAFRLAAVDYLLKPVSLDDLIGAISKVEIRRFIKDDFDYTKVLLSHVKNAKLKESSLDIYKALDISKEKNIDSTAHKLNRIGEQETFKNSHNERFNTLTKRELEVIGLLTKGSDNRKIAEDLFISRHTVEQHRKNINRKLHVNSLAQLFQYALAFDLV